MIQTETRMRPRQSGASSKRPGENWSQRLRRSSGFIGRGLRRDPAHVGRLQPFPLGGEFGDREARVQDAPKESGARGLVAIGSGNVH